MPTTTHARTIRHGLAMPTSKAFPIDWEPTEADILDLRANLIEAACYLMRHRHGHLRAAATLGGLTAYEMPGANAVLGALNASDLEQLVRDMRATAARERLGTEIEAAREAD